MGSRGVSGATYNRKTSLMRRISKLDREIKDIRASAENEIQRKAMQNAKDSIYERKHGSASFWETSKTTAEHFMWDARRDRKYWSQAEAIEVELEDSGRDKKLAKLEANRKALTGEMFELLNGQRRLL